MTASLPRRRSASLLSAGTFNPYPTSNLVHLVRTAILPRTGRCSTCPATFAGSWLRRISLRLCLGRSFRAWPSLSELVNRSGHPGEHLLPRLAVREEPALFTPLPCLLHLRITEVPVEADTPGDVAKIGV